MNLPGLPEGIEAVRWGAPQHGELFLDGIALRHGPYMASALIVKPLPGYVIHYDVATDTHKIGKEFSQPVRVAVQFKVNSESDLSSVREAAQKLNGEIIAQWPSAR